MQGTGLLFSCELAPQYKCYGAGSTEEWLRERGVGVIHGGANSLRFTPHFAMADDELDLLVSMVGTALREGPRRTQAAATPARHDSQARVSGDVARRAAISRPGAMRAAR